MGIYKEEINPRRSRRKVLPNDILNDAFALVNEGEAANFSLTTKWSKKINGQIHLASNYRNKFMHINEGIVELKHDPNSKVFPPAKR